MTKEIYIHWLENMIQGCIDMQGLDREKAIYQHCLKKARKLGQTLRIGSVSNRRELLIDFLDDVLMCQDEGASIVDREKYVDGYLGN